MSLKDPQELDYRMKIATVQPTGIYHSGTETTFYHKAMFLHMGERCYVKPDTNGVNATIYTTKDKPWEGDAVLWENYTVPSRPKKIRPKKAKKVNNGRSKSK